MKDNLIVLKDDLNFFPSYEAVAIYSKGLNPEIKNILKKLERILSEKQVQILNASVIFEKKTFQEVAHKFLEERKLTSSQGKTSSKSTVSEILSKAGTHLVLTFTALFFAIFICDSTWRICLLASRNCKGRPVWSWTSSNYTFDCFARDHYTFTWNWDCAGARGIVSICIASNTSEYHLGTSIGRSVVKKCFRWDRPDQSSTIEVD